MGGIETGQIRVRAGMRRIVLLSLGFLLTAAGLAAFAFIPHGPGGPETGTIGKAGGLLLESGLLVTVAWLTGYSVRQQRGQAADRREQGERRCSFCGRSHCRRELHKNGESLPRLSLTARQ